MNLPPEPPPPQPLAGDFARQRAVKLALWCLALLLTNVLALSNLALWRFIEPLNGAAFYFAAIGFGLVLAALPVLATLCFCGALWQAGNSVALPKVQPTPALDRRLAVLLCGVWFLPVLFALLFAGHSLAGGAVRFPHPKREYVLATDPIAFWESFGFVLIAGGVWAWVAWRYCQWRLLPALRAPSENRAAQ
ncbi:MAG: hypothetical protein IIT59_00780 [Rhodocyclaceae bacterium]|nr:hypothetical protein [Rhodocyclaceae bacterium]